MPKLLRSPPGQFSLLESNLDDNQKEKALNLLKQSAPFWEHVETMKLPILVKPKDFDQRWEDMLDAIRSYTVDLKHQEVVERHINDGQSTCTTYSFHVVRWSFSDATDTWLLSGVLITPFHTHELHSIMQPLQTMDVRKTYADEKPEGGTQQVIQLTREIILHMDAGANTETNTPDENPYPYPALLQDPSAIRLVVLLPSAERHHDIICRLCSSTLLKGDEYEALSYVWGDPDRRRPITVDGRQFQATVNLESALRNLRYLDKPRVLWIDAVCINQNDIEERSSQVQQMGLIYSQAKRVVVWLGPESESSKTAFNTLRVLDIPDPNRAVRCDEKHYKNVLTKSLKATLPLVQRPWFKRVWCVQEFILGEDVIFRCGQDSLPWRQFVRLFEFMIEPSLQRIFQQSMRELGGTICHDLNIFVRRVYSYFVWKAARIADPKPADEPVLKWLTEFSVWEVSNSKDRIFAFYGLISDQDPDREILRPDYNLTVTGVYTRVAIYFLRRYRNLDILSVCTLLTSRFLRIPPYWPSWIPDWGLGQGYSARYTYRSIAFFAIKNSGPNFDTMYNTSAGIEATRIDVEDNDQVLVLDGIDVDVIESIGNIYIGQDPDEFVPQWHEIAGLSRGGNYQYTGQSMREAWWRTILMDDQHDIRTPLSRSRIPQEDVDLHWLQSDFPPSAEDDTKAMKRFIGGVGGRIGYSIFGRRFFRTTKGLFGLAPPAAREGDHVVVLFGGKVPFILGKFEMWYLLFLSYVHGIMDGEIIPQPRIKEFGDLKEGTFHIA
ncbi:heterokaryon incompatibility protein-domain-containing protein [Annulohypoxylon moriforme]|nr:heterokaryon incompatibility protein-domain-containing protein [Annulohypoxylon moriforme]